MGEQPVGSVKTKEPFERRFCAKPAKNLCIGLVFSYTYITRTIKPITDNRRIPDVTVKLRDVRRNDELQLTSISPEIDWHIWLHRQFCLIA